MKKQNLEKSKFFLSFLSLAFLFPLDGFATPDNLIQRLSSDIRANDKSSFEKLLPQIEKKYGPDAVQALFQIASNKKNEDTHRYIALMSATKMGGLAALPLLLRLLKDHSWMMRTGALRALSVLNNSETAEAVLPLLHDPALVVRAEAVEAVQKLKPKGAETALLSTLEDKENYHGKKALWVPQKALLALAQLQTKSAIPQLDSILKNPEHQTDLELLQHLRKTLEVLNRP